MRIKEHLFLSKTVFILLYKNVENLKLKFSKPFFFQKKRKCTIKNIYAMAVVVL